MLEIILLIFAGVTGLTIGLLIKNNEIKRLSVELESVKTLLKNANEKNETYNNLEKIIKEDFTQIANKVIKDEQKDLREQHKEALDEKLKPVKEKFEQFKNKIEEFNKLEEINNASLKIQIENLVKESSVIKNTAWELTQAIKNNSQTRGEFGELILENLLSQSGLINKNNDPEKGNYITQHTFHGTLSPDERQRPDAVVFFPDKKHIIIDSKCPLNNFIEFTKAVDENEKNTQLNLFYNSTLKMIDELSKKYNTLDELNTPEFKLMFIPLEATAGYIYSNKKILDKAIEKNIIIVSPSTLLTSLKMINKIWKQKIQSENLTEILQSATGVYDKLYKFIKNIEDINTKFISLHKSFENFFKTARGKGGFIPQIEHLRDLGIITKNKIDDKYLDETSDFSLMEN